MAITVSSILTTAQDTSNSSWAITPGVACNPFDMLVVVLGCDNAGTSGAISVSSTLADSRNPDIGWTLRQQKNKSNAGSANDSGTITIWTGIVPPSGFSATDTITFSFSPNTAAKTAHVFRLQPTNETFALEYVTGGTADGFNTGYPTTAWTLAPTVSGEVTIVGMASEGTSLATTVSGSTGTGTWTTPQESRCHTSGTADAHQRLATGYFIASGSSTPTWKIGYSASADHEEAYIVIKETQLIIQYWGIDNTLRNTTV